VSTEEIPHLPCEIDGWPGSVIDTYRGDVRTNGFVFSVPWGGWEISGAIGLQDDQIVISELKINEHRNYPVPKGGISSTTLRFPIGRLRADIQRVLELSIDTWLREEQQALNELRAETDDVASFIDAFESGDTARRGRKPYSDGELLGIAWMYLDVQRLHGARRIAEEMADLLGLTVSTVNKRIRRATQAGFLGPAQQGRGGRMPGPLLDQGNADAADHSVDSNVVDAGAC
jgi:hypothetical protein